MSDTAPEWRMLVSALYLNGRRFACRCGCNVFLENRKEPGVYCCQECHARYTGLSEASGDIR